jgi:subtilisin family serine protease
VRRLHFLWLAFLPAFTFAAGNPAAVLREAITAVCANPQAEVPASISIRRIAPGGRLVELHAVYVADKRPELLVIAGADCQVRYGRRIEYSADGRAYEIRFLRADLSDSGAGTLLDAPIPAAPDPGGVAVAHVDSGVNYLLPEIAARLARDADGAALGYDWWDMNPRPFDQDPARSPFFPQRHGTQTASLLLEEAPHARLIPYRYPRPDMARMASLVEAAAKAGARIVTVAMGSTDRAEWQAYEQAVRRHPEMLFIVSAGNDGRDIDREPVYPAALELANQLTVTSAEDDGRLARGSNWGRAVHLLVPAERRLVTGFDGRRVFASGSSYAVARAGALAACLLGAHPQWSAKELRAAILAHGFIPDALERDRGVCAAVPTAVQQRASESLELDSGSYERTLDLSVVAIEGSAWQPAAVRAMLRGAAAIFGQCGIALRKVSVHWLSTPERMRYFTLDTAQALVAARAYAKPAVYLMADTRRPVPFDAEAFAPANSGVHPQLADTVWIMRGMRHPEVALAHELVHVLTNSGEHSSEPGNLMRDETALENTRLTKLQCREILSRGTARGLLVDSK